MQGKTSVRIFNKVIEAVHRSPAHGNANNGLNLVEITGHLKKSVEEFIMGNSEHFRLLHSCFYLELHIDGEYGYIMKCF